MARILSSLVAMLTRTASSRLGAFVIVVVMGLAIGACAAPRPSPWRGVAIHGQDPPRRAGCRGAAAGALSGTTFAPMFLIASAGAGSAAFRGRLGGNRRGVGVAEPGHSKALWEPSGRRSSSVRIMLRGTAVSA